MQKSEEITQQDQQILETSIKGLMESTKDVTELPKYKAKSMAFPPLNMNPNIHAFYKQACLEIEKMHENAGFLDKTLRDQQMTLKSRQSNRNIIIKPADKGGNIVIQNTHQYVAMCEKILTNRTWYEKVEPAALELAHVALKDIIDEAKKNGTIDNDTREFLLVKFPVTPIFYALPKVHKGLNPPPG